MQKTGQTFEEEFKVSGDKVVSKVREIINEGNARRIIIKDKKGKILVEFPLTLGVVGTVFLPTLAAIGALAALVTDCTITVVRDSNHPTSKNSKK